MKTLHSKISLITALLAFVFLQCSSHTQLRPSRTNDYQTIKIKGFDNLPSNSIYRLGVDDQIEIKFFNNDQFDQITRVRPDGRISLPILDEIFVVGMTPLQLDSVITRAFSKYIQQPQVTVFVREFGARQIFLLGQVTTPGVYDISKNMTLLHAIAAAGGLKDSAEPSSIMILRRANRTTISALRVNVKSLLKGRASTSAQLNPIVQPMDIIYVPKTYIASTSHFLGQVYDLLLPPVDMYLRALWYTELLR